MTNTLFRLVIFLVVWISLESCSFDSTKSFNFGPVENIMKAAISDSVFPGAVLLVGNKDTILHHNAYGNFTYDINSPKINTKSIFDLASVSKVVGTTSAAMLLIQEGNLNLDDKVIRYLDKFNNNGKDKITIRNLLLHNSGLSAFKKYYDSLSGKEEIINDIMNLELNNPPGDKYVYSDLGMITLQLVIEKITGKPLDLFLKSELFDKLEMEITMYNPPKMLKPQCVPTEVDDFWRMRLLQGEVHDERAHMLNGVAGHAGLFATALDLSKFVKMLMNGGSYKNSNIFTPELISKWTIKQSEQSDRALGWDTKSMTGYSSAGKYFSDKSFGHTGYTGTSIWIDRKNDLFVILLTNRVHPTRKNRKITKFRPLLHNMIFTVVNNG